MKKILLCGYMASGKTTIARLLAKASGLPYMDLDEVIEQQAGKTIPEIFKEDGEIKFRKIEHETLKEIIEKDSFVLSLGGGTPCYAGNHHFMQREDVVSVYLKTGIGELVARLNQQSGKRPLLEKLQNSKLEEFVAQHLFERSYYYHQAKHTITTDGKTPEDIVNEIMSLF